MVDAFVRKKFGKIDLDLQNKRVTFAVGYLHSASKHSKIFLSCE